MGILSGVAVWVLVAIGIVAIVVWLVNTGRWIRLIAREPAASVTALQMHDRAAGSLGRTAAIVAYLVAGVLPISWGWNTGTWPLWIGGGFAIISLILIERRWPVPGGTVRIARLEPRRLVDVLPRAGTAIATLGVLLAVGTAVMCGLIGQPANAGSAFPWPTWSQIAPDLIGLSAVIALTALAIALLIRRPALAGFGRDIDLVYRRAGVDRALRVISFVGLIEAAVLLNHVQNAVTQTQSVGVGTLLGWQSTALVFGALVSIELFRVHPPKEMATTAAPMAPLERS